MATFIGVGESREIDSFQAGKEAAERALKNAGAQRGDFAFLFATSAHDQKKILSGVRSVFGDVSLSGCTGEGIITQSDINEELFGVGVMLIQSDKIHFFNAVAHNLKENSLLAGEMVGNTLRKNWPKKPKALFIFPDGLAVNTKDFFTGIDNTIKEYVPYIGGISADNWKMLPEFNWQYHDDQAFQDSAACVLMSGELNIEVAISHGCIPLGIGKTVTKANGNRIYEVDNKPAFEVFKEYSDEEIEGLTPELVVHLCFGERLPENLAEDYDRYIIRTPLTHDKRNGSIFIPTEMKTGTEFTLMRRDPETIISNMERIAKKIKEKLGKKKPKAVLHFDCAGRGKILFGRNAAREVEVVQNVFGEDIPWLGFYCYGEIAPIQKMNYYHNYTAVISILY